MKPGMIKLQFMTKIWISRLKIQKPAMDFLSTRNANWAHVFLQPIPNGLNKQLGIIFMVFRILAADVGNKFLEPILLPV